MVKEFQIVDGFPVLEEFEGVGRDTSALGKEMKQYVVDFRMPLKGISRHLISPSLLNVCNMFSTLYLLQMVVIIKSDSIRIPGKFNDKPYSNGIKTVESQPIMLKLV